MNHFDRKEINDKVNERNLIPKNTYHSNSSCLPCRKPECRLKYLLDIEAVYIT